MSEMNLDVICRMKIDGSYTKEEALEFCKKFGFEPEYEDEFYFKKNNGFTFSLFKDRLYLDYYFYGQEPYDINVDIDTEKTNEVCNKIEEVFGSKSEELDSYVVDAKFKVLYYYYGGCAGVCEVE